MKENSSAKNAIIKSRHHFYIYVFLFVFIQQGCVLETDDQATESSIQMAAILEEIGVEGAGVDDVLLDTRGDCNCNGTSIDYDCEYIWVAASESCTIHGYDMDREDEDLQIDGHKMWNIDGTDKLWVTCGFSSYYPYFEGYGFYHLDEIVMFGFDANNDTGGSDDNFYMDFDTYNLSSITPTTNLGDCQTSGYSSGTLSSCTVSGLYGTAARLVTSEGWIPHGDIAYSFLSSFMFCLDIDGE